MRRTSTLSYYPNSFGSIMEDRSYEGDTNLRYRFGFNTQEKDDEVYGKGNVTTAEYWEYDARLGRRWNVDPVRLASISQYICFFDNPFNYTDVEGLYGKEKTAQKMRQRALKNGYEVSEVKKDKSGEYYFVGSRSRYQKDDAGHFYKKRYFSNSLLGDLTNFLKDINPINDGEAYLAAQLKTNINIKPNVKVVIPYTGINLAYSYHKGGNAGIITGLNSYLNVKKGNVDVRITPLSSMLQLDPNKPQGDLDPRLRTFITIMNRPIVIPAGEIPIPIGTIKVQIENGIGKGNLTLGARAVAETIQVGAFSLESAAGFRIELKVPDILTED